MGDHEEDAIMNLDLNLGPIPPASPHLELGSGPSSNGNDGDLGLEEELTELLDRRIRETLWSSWGRHLARAYPRFSRRVDLGQLPDHVDEALLSDEPELANGSSARSLGEILRSRSTRWRWRHATGVPSVARDTAGASMTGSEDNGGPAVAHVGGAMLQIGQGSGAGEERINNDVEKTDETNMPALEDEAADKKEDVEKCGNNDGGFFDCNICLDLARDPIVTCCGHLFCWPCIYRWLHIHSDAKECPVCKGEVTIKNVTPIYGRGNNSTRVMEEDLGIKIPVRPLARRVESLRQAIQRTASSFPIEEMIRRLGNRFDLTRDFLQPSEIQGAARDTIERGQSLLNRILTSRGMRREQSLDISPDNVMDLTQDSVARPEVMEHRRLPSLIYRRAYSQIGTSAHVPPVVGLGERFGDAYNRAPPPAPVRSQEQPPSMDDRDSFSSIAAVIHGESQTVDTAVEIDSMISLSTSSSRRRADASRVSDMDSGDSRAPRRRRLN
ncbi:hypothetical protein Dimus_001885 [Dionaea muscipula]